MQVSVHTGDIVNDKEEEEKNARAMRYMRHHVKIREGEEDEREYRKDDGGGTGRVKTLRKQGRALSLKLRLVSRGWNWITWMDKQPCVRVHIAFCM